MGCCRCGGSFIKLCLFDFVRDWRFGFGLESWDFVVVCGLILACGHGSGGGGGGGGNCGSWFAGVWVAMVVDVIGRDVDFLFVHK